MSEPIGRRERKKAQTRKALADAALELFAARGYDQVGVREIADAADVSVTTLFKYFPTKEALVFDLDEDVEAALVAAVCQRAPDQPLLAALHEHLRDWVTAVAAAPTTPVFARLVEETPVLSQYASRMWLRHETALARAIAAETGAAADDLACSTLARFALEAVELARKQPDPGKAIDTIFDLLNQGWASTHPAA